MQITLICSRPYLGPMSTIGRITMMVEPSKVAFIQTWSAVCLALGTAYGCAHVFTTEGTARES